MRENQAALRDKRRKTSGRMDGTVIASVRERMKTSSKLDYLAVRLIAAMLFLGVTCHAYSQGTLVYDQQSATNGIAQGGSHIQSSALVGQSFTPTASFIGFVALQFTDTVPNNGVGSTVYVSLRENSIAGNELAATLPASLRDNFFGITNLMFSGNVPIIAGNMYFLVPVLQAGDDNSVRSDFYNYTGGTAFFFGQPDANNRDLWFREGYIVPEPSVVCLTLAGAVVVLSVRHRKLPTR